MANVQRRPRIRRGAGERAIDALPAVTLWTGTLAYAVLGQWTDALLLAVLAAPLTGAALWAPGNATARLLGVAVAVAGWGSATGAIPQVPPWDRLEHGVGGVLLTLLLGGVLERRTSGKSGPVGLQAMLVAGALTCFLAVVWEGLEAVSDHLAATDFSLSRADTLGDLLAGAAGATLAVLGREAMRAQPRARATRIGKRRIDADE